MNHEEAMKLNKRFCDEDEEINDYTGPIRHHSCSSGKVKTSKKLPEGEGHSEASYYCAYNQCGWL